MLPFWPLVRRKAAKWLFTHPHIPSACTHMRVLPRTRTPGLITTVVHRDRHASQVTPKREMCVESGVS